MKSKTDKVLHYLINNGYVTSYMAFEKWHLTRLSSVIFELRKRGWEIDTVNVRKKHVSYARYFIRPEKNNNAEMIENYKKQLKARQEKNKNAELIENYKKQLKAKEGK